MTLRTYLLLMSLGTALCWLAWGFILWNINPTEADLLGFFFFYLSLFLAIVGTVSVMGFVVRRLFIQNDTAVFRHVRHTFRQSFIFASAIIFLLILAAHHLLAWWNFLFLVLVVVGLEGVVFTKRKYTGADYVR